VALISKHRSLPRQHKRVDLSHSDPAVVFELLVASLLGSFAALTYPSQD
jgi:hypothetical protein